MFPSAVMPVAYPPSVPGNPPQPEPADPDFPQPLPPQPIPPLPIPPDQPFPHPPLSDPYLPVPPAPQQEPLRSPDEPATDTPYFSGVTLH